jgi:hypothetical protein
MTNGNSGGNGMLYFLVGALCVAVAVGGYFMFHGGSTFSSVAQAPVAAPSAPAAVPTETKNITIEKKTVETPKVVIERH